MISTPGWRRPVGKHVRGAIIDQIDGPVRLEIDQQRAIAAWLPTYGHLIDAQDAGAAAIIRIRERMQNPQERIRADRHADLAREASATFAAGL
jgi:hypothetical protein